MGEMCDNSFAGYESCDTVFEDLQNKGQVSKGCGGDKWKPVYGRNIGVYNVAIKKECKI